MSRAMVIFMVLAGLIATTYAATITINVGDGGLKFNPQNSTATMGDTLLFKWVSTANHGVQQSDAPAGSCTKSAAATAFASTVQAAGQFTTMVNQTSGKIWFYCPVATHCQSGMWGVVTITSPDATTSPSTGSSTSASNTTSTTTSNGSSNTSTPTDSSAPSPSSNNTEMIVGATVSGVFDGIFISVANFFFYRWYRVRKRHSLAIPTPGTPVGVNGGSKNGGAMT